MTMRFEGGSNIALTVPPHEYEATVRVYRDTLGLPLADVGGATASRSGPSTL